MAAHGQPVSFARRKSESLLAYLALHPGPQSREKIAGLFWGELPNEDARRTLRVVLSDIRKTLGDDTFSGERNTLGLNPACVAELDTQKFSALLQKPESASNAGLAAALELYRGDLLDGMYDDWLLPLREHFRAMWLAAALLLIERQRAEGDYARVIQSARSLLQREPASEKAHQHLIFCLSASGEREAALQQYNICREALDRYLGQQPSAETIALVENIKKRSAESSSAARQGNLPRPLTSFIGREDELNEVETLLTETRLLTLLGPGGSGKTRLAIQAADEVAHDYPGGIWWVDLAPLAEPELVTQSIAKTLGVREQAGQSLLALTVAAIGEKRLLLALDNCEHLLAASARSVEFLLAGCPALTILATSRQALGLSGEIGWQVPTLPLPENPSNLKALKKNEAARLFSERGRAANVNFQLNEQSAASVVEICRRLDGLPLAIELAAALLCSLTVFEVASRLDQKFQSLAAEDGARLPRQQTLRALVDWSYALLTPAEQMIFRRLGVFAGGWTVETATTVAGGFDLSQGQVTFPSRDQLAPLPIRPADIIQSLLDSLQRRSLIARSQQADATRYTMLETLREYALERLTEAGELSGLRDRHLQEMLRFALEVEKQLQGSPDQLSWLNIASSEMDNIRAALARSLNDGDIWAGLQMGVALSRFWTMRDFRQEGRDWLEKLARHPCAQADTPARAHLLLHQALSLRNTDDMDKSLRIVAEAERIFEQMADQSGLAFAHYCRGEIGFHLHDFSPARAALLKALDYYHAHPGSLQTHSSTLAVLGRIALSYDNFDEARTYLDEALNLSRQQGDQNGVGWAALVLGDIAYQQDNLPRARVYYEESLVIYQQMNRLGNLAYLYEVLASLALADGALDQALKLVNESIRCYDQSESWSTFSRSLRAALALMQGDWKTSETWLRRCITPLSDVEPEYRAIYLVRLAEFTLFRGRAALATTLSHLALKLDSDPGIVLFPPDLRLAVKLLASARAVLPAPEYDAALALGENLTFEGAVRLAL